MSARRVLASSLILAFTLAVAACSSDPGPAPGDSGAREGGTRESGTGDGKPSPGSLQVSSQSLDFGKVGCGAPAPAAKTIELTNSGAASITWGAKLVPANGFTIAPVQGTLAPGAKGSLTVTPAAVPATASAGAPVQATLTLVADDPAHSSVAIPITLMPSGGTLTLAPAPADFGLVPIGVQAEDITVTLSNTGNEAIGVVLAQPADPQFTVAWNGSPASVQVAPGATLPGLVARFKPSQPQLSTSSAKLTVTGSTCGTIPAGLPLTGRGATGSLGIQPGSLDFGKVNCGAVASAKTVTLSNSGNAAIAYQTAMTAGASSPFTVVPATGSIPPNAKATLTVTPMPIPAAALTGNDLMGDTLTITTDVAGGTPQAIVLHQTAQGARIIAAATSLGFGSVPVAQSKTAALELSNQGNLPATITLATAAPFSVTPGTAQSFAASSKLGATVVFAPTDSNPAAGTLTISAKTGDVLCAPLPAPIALTGNGTKGALSVSATNLDFGDVNCGTTAAAQSFEIMNAGTSGFSWTAALGKGASSWYALSLASGSSAPGAIAAITVTPKAIPATSAVGTAAYADSITITTDIPGDTPQTLQLAMNAFGAVIAFSSSAAIDLGKVPAGSTVTSPVAFQNSGNADAPVSIAISGGPVFSLEDVGPFPLEPSNVETVNLVFEPVAVGVQTATVTLSVPSSIPLCAPLPTRQVTGNGTNGTVTLSTSTLDFGQTDCGKTAAAKTVILSNPGTARYNFTAEILGSSAEAYTVAPVAGFVDPGQSATLTVTPPAIPTASPITANLYGDTLTIESDAFGDTPHTVSILQTARGAILGVTPAYLDLGTVMLGATGTGPLTVSNTGNAPASVSFSSPQPVFSVAPQGQSVAGGASLAATASFKPTVVGAAAAIVTVTVPAGTAVCDDLPTVELEGWGDVP